MGKKRQASGHQKQILFLSLFFGALMIIAVVGLLLLINRPVGGYGH